MPSAECQVPSVPIILVLASYIVIVFDFRTGIFLNMNDTVTVTASAFLPSSTDSVKNNIM